MIGDTCEVMQIIRASGTVQPILSVQSVQCDINASFVCTWSLPEKSKYCKIFYFRRYQFSGIEENLHFSEYLITWFCQNLQYNLLENL